MEKGQKMTNETSWKISQAISKKWAEGGYANRKKPTHKEHCKLWKQWIETQNPSMEELWDLEMSYEPHWDCGYCGHPDFTMQCRNCGIKKGVLRQSREEFEIGELKEKLKMEDKTE